MVYMPTKICSYCGTEKDKIEFYARAGKCKPCTLTLSKNKREVGGEELRKYKKEYDAKNKEKNSFYRRLKKYGITKTVYENLLEKQKGACAICGTTEVGSYGSLCVDHDHSDGSVRGLLCGKCNMALGLFKDSIQSLKSAINYLENTITGI